MPKMIKSNITKNNTIDDFETGIFFLKQRYKKYKVITIENIIENTLIK